MLLINLYDTDSYLLIHRYYIKDSVSLPITDTNTNTDIPQTDTDTDS